MAEAFRCGAELRRGTVRDYALCCQGLRRLGFRPWTNALRPIISELRWRLHRQRWRTTDMVYVLRFLAELGVAQLPRLPEARALYHEILERIAANIGDMKHFELAHLAHALTVPGAVDATPDAGLLSRIAESFTRRTQNLTLGALLHFTRSLVRARVIPPEEFLNLFVTRTQAELSRLRPSDVAFVAVAAARLEIRDASLLRSVDRAVGANLDAFNFVQIGDIAESFDVMGHRNRSLLEYVEHQLFLMHVSQQQHGDGVDMKPQTKGQEEASFAAAASPRTFSRDRCRMLAALIGAAAGTPAGRWRVSEDSLSRCVDELSIALGSLQHVTLAESAASTTPPKGSTSHFPAGAAAALQSNHSSWSSSSPSSFVPLASLPTRIEHGATVKPPPLTPLGGGRRKRRQVATAPSADAVSTTDSVRSRRGSEGGGSRVDVEDNDSVFFHIDAAQLEALSEIADSLGDDQQEPLNLLRGDEGKGALGPVSSAADMMSSSGRRKLQLGKRLKVSSFVPTGSTVVRAKASVRRLHFERILGGRHPAARRVHRRLIRLEEELKLEGASGCVSGGVGDIGDRPQFLRREQLPRVRVRGATAQARAAIVWRRLRRYRLGAFQADGCSGRFVREKLQQVAIQRPKVQAVSHWSPVPMTLSDGGLSLQHAAALCDAITKQSCAELRGRDALLQQLGRHCWLIVRNSDADRWPNRKVLFLLSRVAFAFRRVGLTSPQLASAFEIALGLDDIGVGASANGTGAVCLQQRRWLDGPKALAQILVVYSYLTAVPCSRSLFAIDRTLHSLGIESHRAEQEMTVCVPKKPLLTGAARASPTLWSLSAEEIGDALMSVASFLRDPRLLDTGRRTALLRGLRQRLIAVSKPETGAQPPGAAALSRLVAASLWLRRRRDPSEMLPPAAAEALKRWSVSPKRAWAELESCQLQRP
eukprot:TRINITY_DN24180_c0_g3_i1.p1 TRINITY_DN24180_c0_g3~~TRINITY_DN24180_c0_g3_i1.p1  ORF type:complete len:1084 (+),score=169.90 TRINITY_DN24180_c0_g3_i1:458-3253(+)